MARLTASEVLAAASIPADRWGYRRTQLLDAAQASFYRSILARMAAGEIADRAALESEATRLELHLEETLAVLAREDLVHLDADRDRVRVAYPFSGEPTRHRVLVAGRTLYAMCAIDALGIAFMLLAPIEVVSSDPETEEEIRVQLDAAGIAAWQPRAVLVLAACRSGGDGTAAAGCCAVVNFFASEANAEAYLGQGQQVRGRLVSIPEAAEAGRLLFAHALSVGNVADA